MGTHRLDQGSTVEGLAVGWSGGNGNGDDGTGAGRGALGHQRAQEGLEALTQGTTRETQGRGPRLYLLVAHGKGGSEAGHDKGGSMQGTWARLAGGTRQGKLGGGGGGGGGR